ncbi:MAG: DUF4384 domain-containing protein [Thermodesulfobacteriota bacterium]
MKKRILTILALAGCLTLNLGQPGYALEVRSAGGLRVTFEPVKTVFQVNEPIKFKIKANKQFFLYLFSLDKQTNQGVLIMPNELYQGNMYQADAEFIAPPPNYEFFAQNPGLEKIIMVASTAWLELDHKKYTKSGGFFTGQAVDMEAEAKSLVVRGLKKDVVSSEVDVVIVGSGPAPQAGSAAPPVQAPAGSPTPAAPFVSTDKIEYKVGDKLKITFGADKKGYVYLVLVEPDGTRQVLKKQEVSGENIYQVQGLATAPAGRQTLFAVYDESGELGDVDRLKLPVAGEVKDKGILLLNEKERPYAAYGISVAP